jgi:MFS superfamily sulfate permease-like transporter
LYAYGSTLKKITANSAIGQVVTSVKAKVPSATGISGVANIFYAITHPQTWDIVPAAIFICCVIFIMKSNTFLPRSMPPGSEVLIATAAATIYSVYFDYNGGVVGEIPTLESSAGLSIFGLVKIPIELMDFNKLFEIPIAERCFDGSMVKLYITAAVFSGVNFLSIVGIASGFEAENAVAWSASRELIAQVRKVLWYIFF